MILNSKHIDIDTIDFHLNDRLINHIDHNVNLLLFYVFILIYLLVLSMFCWVFAYEAFNFIILILQHIYQFYFAGIL